MLKIAEVASRFQSLAGFVKIMKSLGFHSTMKVGTYVILSNVMSEGNYLATSLSVCTFSAFKTAVGSFYVLRVKLVEVSDLLKGGGIDK